MCAIGIKLLMLATFYISKFILKLKNYEEEIKAYGVERKQLVEKIQQLEYEDKRVNMETLGVFYLH